MGQRMIKTTYCGNTVLKYIVDARRYFDKKNGNTYHSVIITNIETDNQVSKHFVYGYGDHYKQTAKDLIVKAEWEKEEDLTHDFVRNTIYFTVADVRTQRELKEFEG